MRAIRIYGRRLVRIVHIARASPAGPRFRSYLLSFPNVETDDTSFLFLLSRLVLVHFFRGLSARFREEPIYENDWPGLSAPSDDRSLGNIVVVFSNLETDDQK